MNHSVNPAFERGFLRALAQQGLTPDRAENLLRKQALDGNDALKGMTWLSTLALVAPPVIAGVGGYLGGRALASGYDGTMDVIAPKSNLAEDEIEKFKNDELARQMLNRMERLRIKDKHRASKAAQ